MTSEKPHITVCVCTFKRPLLLRRLLTELSQQRNDGKFTFSVVIVDNDRERSAEEVVRDFDDGSRLSIRYCVEPDQNIALARNRAVDNGGGEYLAFLDDDEFPVQEWLTTLYEACQRYGSDGVLGPVNPHFEKECPRWLSKGGICDRKCPTTGTIVRYQESRTGNVLLKRNIFDDPQNRFDPRFGRTGGEDVDFFRRVTEKGYSFIWCREAVAYETVPPERWKASYYVKRYVRLGGLAGEAMRKDGGGGRRLPRAVAAVSIYLALLPFSLLVGKHAVVNCLMKGGYHLAWLSGYCGHVPIRLRDD